MRKERDPNRRFLGKYDAFKYGWLQYIKLIVTLIIIVFVVFRFLIGFSYVSGHSMDTTLHAGEVVMYCRVVPEYKPGDIVSVHMPSGEYYVKRVLGVPGDVIEIKDGQLVINGWYVSEDYATGITEAQTGIVKYPYTVQEGDLFILGDNREASIDSRTFGAINQRQVRGRIFFHTKRKTS